MSLTSTSNMVANFQLSGIYLTLGHNVDSSHLLYKHRSHEKVSEILVASFTRCSFLITKGFDGGEIRMCCKFFARAGQCQFYGIL